MIKALTPVLAVVLTVSACERQAVNLPTEPAAPPASSEVSPAAASPPGVGPALPGAGPATFVGRWAGNAGWCANTTGAEQPITLTPLRFEGYEHSCTIDAINQVADGYALALTCQAGGTVSRERVRLSVQENVLRLTWLNRNDAVVLLVRCPAEAGTPRPPS